MSTRLFARTGSVAAAASLALLAAGPAFAATPVAQASATAYVVGLAGQGTDSGSYRATHDGTTQTTSGSNTPALTALGGQTLTNVGTLAQDATTAATGGDGSSAACSGVAGEGATVLQAGEGTRCLVGGRTITLDAANLDFSRLSVIDAEALEGINGPLRDALLVPVATAIRTALTGMGNPGIYVDLGAVQAVCTASTSSAQGSANIANGSVYVQGPGINRVDLVNLPLNPPPNFKPVTDLSGLLTVIQAGLDAELAALSSIPGLDALLTPVQGGLATVIGQIKANVTDALGPQLKPLQDNLLDLTLNAQSRPAGNAIEVTALDLRVLPAAQQFLHADLVDVSIGRVACGPNGRASAPGLARAPQPIQSVPGDDSVPVAVTSGAADLESDPSTLAMLGLAGLVLAGTTAGVIGFRRSLRQ